MKLKMIEAGEFMMGSESGKPYEKPIHNVRITKSFHIGMYEVTQAQYEKIMQKNPSKFRGRSKPVECVSWDDAVLFCKRLSEKEGVEYRLPTEAEWEYACRAGTRTEYYWGNEMNGRYAWYRENIQRRTHRVGLKKPNAWGLYDMSGNVREWCSDRFGRDYYKISPEADPQGPRTGSYRVLRGGSWYDIARCCRSAWRLRRFPPAADSLGGFRVVREVE
jgi:formylglycine-generating enzyme required for sulfatase activity